MSEATEKNTPLQAAVALTQIREIQKTLRAAETGAVYQGNPSDPRENIDPWDRAGKAIAALSQNREAVNVLAEKGITFKNGWLHGPDGISIRSRQLDPITVTPDLPREATVQGFYGRPDIKLTTDVIELPGMRPEHRFMPVVKGDGEIMREAGNRFSAYPTREEALKAAPVLLRNRIDDDGYKVVSAPIAKQEAPMNETIPQAKRHLQEVKRENQQEVAQNFWQQGVRAGRELRQASEQVTAAERKETAEDKPRQLKA